VDVEAGSACGDAGGDEAGGAIGDEAGGAGEGGGISTEMSPASPM